MIKKIVLILLTTILLPSCYVNRQVSMQNEAAHAYLGLSRQQAISILGEPARAYQSTEHNEVLVWEWYDAGKQNLENRIYLDLTFTNNRCIGVETNKTRTVRQYDKTKTILATCVPIGGTAVLAGIIFGGISLGEKYYKR